MDNSEYCIILTTTDSIKVANTIAHELVENNLSACVQINDIDSIYKWDNKITQSKEFRLVIKAKTDQYQNIENLILSLHNYTLPQIIQIAISNAYPPYLLWLSL